MTEVQSNPKSNIEWHRWGEKHPLYGSHIYTKDSVVAVSVERCRRPRRMSRRNTE